MLLDGSEGLFLSTPSARRATTSTRSASPSMEFLSTPSARRATNSFRFTAIPLTISIHALCEEGDDGRRTLCPIIQDFYPRPLRGGRLRKVRAKSIDNIFLSTPSARRATAVDGDRPRDVSISIHALCEEGDSRRTSSRSAFGYFYPRPLRGGRLFVCHLLILLCIFLSTPSARRATQPDLGRHYIRPISIHALCEEGDFFC